MVRQALRAVDRASNDAQVHIRSRTRTKAGDIVWVDWYASRVVIPELDAESVLFFTLDVTESVEARASLTHAARYDSLTLIPNRQSFYDWLEQHQVTDSPHGHVLFIDLDGFKEVNDRYGHHAGDRLLQNVATRLTRLLSANDFCARYGGDEFTLFVAERPSAPPISMVAENIISELRRPFEVGELNIELSCSVGIASTRDHAQDPQAIVSSADLAMFQAKANGRDQYTLYSQTLGDRHRRRSHLHAGLRDALRSGEISVAFQPRVDITSGQIVGAEALARWTQTDGTVVAPNDFIPVAEETGLIHDLGAFVLQQSCELARHVNEQQVGPTPRFVVSVNLSTIQLRQPQFVQRAKAIFASAGCLPNWIEFEVTESRELTDPVCLDRLVDLVERFGAKCSLDDFGTGYSNLMELTHLPLTALKIDRSFVSNLTKTNSSVVAAVIALGHSLKIDVVAEGVETADQLDQLRTMGASSYQGYFHSRPEPRAILCRTLGVTNP
jgi:diguanylate cyclase (GGDEF)-like protein